MKLKFKVQDYQSKAVQAVVDCFARQTPQHGGVRYRLDTGAAKAVPTSVQASLALEEDQVSNFEAAFRNADVTLSEIELLENIQQVQLSKNLPVSADLVKTKISKINLDIEMETGTGKTYCYIKTIFELNKQYGWSKFIIVVPSIAIREGVAKSLEITAEHFLETYQKKARCFIYNSKELHHLERFSTDAGINVMVINVQAFNATGKDNRRIYEELDDFQSRKPIDVISANRPIMILDEPQKMEGGKTLNSLVNFKPLMVLRYSATHKTIHNKIHRLDALDAYNQKLVKKIAVRGVESRGANGASAFLYLEGIDISKQAPVARVAMEVKQKSGKIKRKVLRLKFGDNLYVRSGEMEQYRDRYVVQQIDALTDTVEFSNGKIIHAGVIYGDVSEQDIRRIQIRETIKAHLENELRLFSKSIKVLSLFFIDEVAKYRDYNKDDEKGEYARIFEEEYLTQVEDYFNEVKRNATLTRLYQDENLKCIFEKKGFIEFIGKRESNEGFEKYKALLEEEDFLQLLESDDDLKNRICMLLENRLPTENKEYSKYLGGIKAEFTHSGYFSIDKKTKKLKDPTVEKRGENAGQSNDVDAYDLILKDKERLLSLDEPVRFIFSHSALREGWDNPNVFVICTLKHSDNTISRRQEVGRGLRIAVNTLGERMDNQATVHDINVLTVVASESYKDFVTALQKDISETLSQRPRVADKAYFTGKVLSTADGVVTLTEEQAAGIEFYLIQNGYVDIKRNITEKYHAEKKDGKLAELPEELKPMAEQVFGLVDTVYSDAQLMVPENDRNAKKLVPNANFDKREFKELWKRINRKAAYSVQFDDAELIKKSVATLNDEDNGLRVTPLQFTVQTGEQATETTYDDLKSGNAFTVKETVIEKNQNSAHSMVKYDLIGKVAEGTLLTRRTVAKILSGLNKNIFAQFKTNPESFIAEACRLINEQKSTMVIQHLAYDPIEDTYDLDIFTSGQTKQVLSSADKPLKRHIYDFVITDSDIERQFVKGLDTCTDVVVYAKLPHGFLIPTPVGDYNPDWAISFKEGSVKHVYFVAENKGSRSSKDLREIEKSKIECARKFFDTINKRFNQDNVKYDVADTFESLMQVVKG